MAYNLVHLRVQGFFVVNARDFVDLCAASGQIASGQATDAPGTQRTWDGDTGPTRRSGK